MVLPFALMLKSYSGDFEYASRMVESFNAHNPTKLPLFVVVPADDVRAFAAFESDTITVQSDEFFRSHLVDQPIAGLRPGYINQEIIKLAFHETGHAENYFCVDSDAIFIRDLRLEDFIAPDNAPYSVLVQDKDLEADPTYFQQYWRGRDKHVRAIAQEVGYTDPILRTCHGHQVMSSIVLRSFVTDFLTPRGWGYRDALALAPLEFTWYNTWLQHSGVIPVHQIEPLMKVFHDEKQHQQFILSGASLEDLARAYIGVVLNASFDRELSGTSLIASKPAALAPYLSYSEVIELLSAKARDTARRRFGSRT